MGVTPERAKQVSFTQAYAGIEIVVYGDKDVQVKSAQDLSGKSIGLVRASTQDGALVATAPADVKIQRFDDDATVVQALLSGQTEMLAASSIAASQIEQRAPGRFDVKFKLPYEQRQAIAIRPGNDELLAYINAFIVEMKDSGELEALSQKWVGSPIPAFRPERSLRESLAMQEIVQLRDMPQDGAEPIVSDVWCWKSGLAPFRP